MLKHCAPCLLSLVLVCSASAQPPQHAALVHLEGGKKLFHAGQLQPASVELMAALETGPTAEIARDARYLLGRCQLELGDAAAAARTLQEAIDRAIGEAATSLVDNLRFTLGSALRKLKRYEEATLQFRRVSNDRMSPHREAAGFLAAKMTDLAGHEQAALEAYRRFAKRWPDSHRGRDVRLRIARLELAGGEHRRAILRLKKILQRAPESRAGRAALDELKQLVADGNVLARTDSPADRLSRLEWLVRERRFVEALEPAKAFLASVKGRHRAPERMRALEILARIYEQTRRETKALETYATLQKISGFSLPIERRARLTALSGDYEGATSLILRRFRGKKTRLYWRKIADLHYTFGRYEAAYEAYVKAMPGSWQKAHRRGIKRLSSRMAWCLLAMNRADEVVEYFRRKRGKRLRDRMGHRYWYGRALQLSGKGDEALKVMDQLASAYPFKYYGILAHSRGLEMRNSSAQSSPPAIPNSTIEWTATALRPAFDEAPKPADEATRLRSLDRLADRWGWLAPEAMRAQELARLGFHDEALVEIRTIDMDLRASRRGLRHLVGRARADLLDNRHQVRARGGARIRDGGRRDRNEARRFRRNARQIRHAIRQVQIAYGDYYGIRRAVYERRNLRAETPKAHELDMWKRAYPIAYPDLVGVFSEHHEVPGYFLYSIMSVESTFHPHPVSVANAYGLLQVIPRTGRRLASELGVDEFSPELLLKPEVSVYFGSYYLGQLLEKFQGQELLAAAAYNAGPHRVEAWLRANSNRPMDLFVENIPYNESRGYARSVLERIAHYRRLYHGEERIYASNHLNADCLAQPNY